MKVSYKIPAFLMLIIALANCGQKSDNKNSEATEPEMSELSPEEFRTKLASTPDAVLIDVRKPEEVAEGMIEGAVNIDYSDPTFIDKIEQLDKSKPYFIYCKSGKRSGDAAADMIDREFQNVFVLKGGYKEWSENN